MTYYLMNDFEKGIKSLESFKKNNDLKYDSQKKKWNKEFHNVVDDNGKFLKWKLGPRLRKTCTYCGKILDELRKDYRSRHEKYCDMSHGKLLRKIVQDAKDKFNLKDFDPEKDDPKTFKNWGIWIKPIYEYSRNQLGQLTERKIKERIERKDIIVTINGKSYPLTEKKRTIQS